MGSFFTTPAEFRLGVSVGNEDSFGQKTVIKYSIAWSVAVAEVVRLRRNCRLHMGLIGLLRLYCWCKELRGRLNKKGRVGAQIS